MNPPEPSDDVLKDFDFDSFLHGRDSGSDGFNFDSPFQEDSPPPPPRTVLLASFADTLIDHTQVPNRAPSKSLGGPGTYAPLGARILNPSPPSEPVSWYFAHGRAVPSALLDEARGWGLHVDLEDVSGQNPRRSVMYTGEDLQDAQITEVVPVSSDLDTRLELHSHCLRSLCYHFCGTPANTENAVSQVLNERYSQGIEGRPLVIWEPDPRACNPESRRYIQEVAQDVDVVSPNHRELLSMYGYTDLPKETAVVLKATIEGLAEDLIQKGIGPDGDGLLIVRTANLGCMTMSRSLNQQWHPPYHAPTIEQLALSATASSSAVVDPTGAGSAFLGAFGASFVKTKDLSEAVACGAVAASYFVEQSGLPRVEGGCVSTVWNGDDAVKRLVRYKKRGVLVGDETAWPDFHW